MNHNYESVKETMITQGIDVPESYIERALKELSFERFPEVGLSDIGLNKLVKTATDIYHSDVDLIPRKKESYNPKITPVKVKSKSKKESKLIKVIEKISLPLPTLATITILGGIMYQDSKNLVGSIAAASFCGFCTAITHYLLMKSDIIN
jgi:hypothetical protein